MSFKIEGSGRAISRLPHDDPLTAFFKILTSPAKQFDNDRDRNKGATGKWCQLGFPHKGWTCTGIEDLGEAAATCEMCETQEIRYVHHMEHPDYSGSLACGCVCAGRMEENYEGARRRMKVCFRECSWSPAKVAVSGSGRCRPRGNLYLNADGYNVVVFPRASVGWGFRGDEP